MALDEPKDNDDTHEFNGFKFLVDKDLQEKAQPIKVDFSGFGFKIDCGMVFDEQAGGCSGCGTTSDCCG